MILNGLSAENLLFKFCGMTVTLFTNIFKCFRLSLLPKDSFSHGQRAQRTPVVPYQANEQGGIQ